MCPRPFLFILPPLDNQLSKRMAIGLVLGAGLGTFAQVYGYRQFEPVITWAAVVLIVVFVQAVQFLGNWLARKVLRR